MEEKYYFSIPESKVPRIVIIGGGFAGLKMARSLRNAAYQVVLIDKNNYHQFQPLFYQVAMSGLEPSSIVFPLRKAFQNQKQFYFRNAEVIKIDSLLNEVQTDRGWLAYDYLIIAIGADTNFFGNQMIADHALPMKSVSEALYLRNKILEDLETALNIHDYEARQSWLDIVIVGGGPTGVEVAGALAEMRKYILPKDYKELNPEEIDIHLIESGPSLLAGMSEVSGKKAEEFLLEMGVLVKKNTQVISYDGRLVSMKDGSMIQSHKLIWAAGVTGNRISGLPEDVIVKGNRIKVDTFNKVQGSENIYAIGDIASMVSDDYPYAHPQVAQVAMQQGQLLAKNLIRKTKGREERAFNYVDKGSMATIGKNKAVADLPFMKLNGFLAWLIWLAVHLLSLIGVKNKLLVFINWIINYMTYDPSLRLIIRPRVPKKV
ncbi:MAG: NAD(P)/FAD-dependent oxidoreductase [Saprospiraceae bacterium]|nr:NAD(P)/FAD-dependent oxidoreductase [Saprospiraceae bacterium]